jgi:hypothetical protein
MSFKTGLAWVSLKTVSEMISLLTCAACVYSLPLAKYLPQDEGMPRGARASRSLWGWILMKLSSDKDLVLKQKTSAWLPI